MLVFMGFYTIGWFFTISLQSTDLAMQWDSTLKAIWWSLNTIKTSSYINVTVNITSEVLISIVIPLLRPVLHSRTSY